MRWLVLSGVLALVAACGTIEYDTGEPQAAPRTEPNEVPEQPAPAPRPVEPAPPPTPPSPPGPCSADASHCCMDDGTLVRPGGCQPSYPPGVQAATERGPDGRCRSIPCFLRCLPESTSIAAPGGDVPIASLEAGDLVYTRGANGERVVAPVLRVVAREVAAAHSVVELTLDDGRRVRGSRGHPLADEGTMGALRVGDPLDGATVVGVRPMPYEGAATWDLLPAGQSGTYWADGVLLGSTLTDPGQPHSGEDYSGDRLLRR